MHEKIFIGRNQFLNESLYFEELIINSWTKNISFTPKGEDLCCCYHRIDRSKTQLYILAVTNLYQGVESSTIK